MFWPCTVAANKAYSLHVTVTHRHTFTQLLKCVYFLDWEHDPWHQGCCLSHTRTSGLATGDFQSVTWQSRGIYFTFHYVCDTGTAFCLQEAVQDIVAEICWMFFADHTTNNYMNAAIHI